MSANTISIVVVMADRHNPKQHHLELMAPVKVGEVIDTLQQQGILEKPLPSQIRLGIYGDFVKFDTELKHQDRLELYIPRRVDPKSARRSRVKK